MRLSFATAVYVGLACVGTCSTSRAAILNSPPLVDIEGYGNVFQASVVTDAVNNSPTATPTNTFTLSTSSAFVPSVGWAVRAWPRWLLGGRCGWEELRTNWREFRIRWRWSYPFGSESEPTSKFTPVQMLPMA